MKENIRQNTARNRPSGTGQKRGEANPKMSVRQWQNVFNSISDSICLLDMKGKILQCNRSMESLLGKPADKIIGRSCWELMHGSAGLIKGCPPIRMRETLKKETLELKSGNKWLHIVVNPILDDKGKVTGALQVISNITRHKQIEEALREGEKKYRLLFNENPQPMWVYDLETLRFLTVNDAAVSRYGYSEEEFLRMTIKDIRPEEDVPALLENIAHVTAGFDDAGVWRHRKKDGTLIFVEISSHTIEFEGRKAEIVMANDLTDRKRAEEALKESEERFRTTIDNANEGILIAELKTRKFRYCNRMICQMLGYSPEELTRLGLENIHPEKEIPHVIDQFEKLARKEIVLATDIPVKRKDGTVFYADINSSPINISGRHYLTGFFRDITERKQAEEAMQQLSKNLGTILTISQTLAATLNLDTVLQLIVESAPQLTGLDSAAIYLIKGDELYLGATTPPLPSHFPDTFRRTLLSDHPHIQESVSTGLPVILSDATTSPLSPAERTIIESRGLRSILYLPLLIKDRAVGMLILGTVGKTRMFSKADIDLYRTLSIQAALAVENATLFETVQRELDQRKLTEEKLLRLNESLKESELKFRSLAQAASDGIILADDTGQVVFWNEGAAKIFGFTAEEITGRPLTDLMPEKYRNDHLRGMERVNKTGKTPYMGRIMELEGVTKNGDVFPLELCVSFWLSKERMFFMGIIRDITERKDKERELREIGEKYKSLFDSTMDGIYRTDKKSLFTIANKACAEIFGYNSAEELIGRHVLDYWYDQEDREAFVANLRKTRSVKLYPVKARNKKGEIIYLETSSHIVEDDSGNFIGIEGIIRDVTQHRKLEEQFRQVQKIEGIGQLAGGIAHDFNNVLNAVVGYAGLLQMQIDITDPRRHFADEIAAAGLRGAALTQQILAFSRKQVLDMKPSDLNEIIRSIEKMLHRLVREDIKTQISLFDKELVILADASQITQVLINLVINARDAMPNIGRLCISTGSFVMDDNFIETHGFGAPGEYALLMVSDTGFGMDAETLSHIFEPFFTTKGVGKGTGLGLAVVHGIIRQHGGYINVYSEVGKGTVFNIYLPLTASPAEPREEKAGDTIRGGTETLLVAEDDASLRKLATTVLMQYGYNVIEAVDGEDAVQKYLKHCNEVKLVILDGIMPKKSGKETLEEMRKVHPDVKAIFISGYSDDIFISSELSDKSVAFLKKPMRPDDLAKNVREMLDKET